MLFNHSADQLIRVSDDNHHIYHQPLATFLLDSQLPYSLPEGYIGRYYDPKGDHYLIKGSAADGWNRDNQVMQPTPWDEGDRIISIVVWLLDAQLVREDKAHKLFIEEQELLRQKQQEQTELAANNPTVKYQNALQQLSATDLLNRLLSSTATAGIFKLLLASFLLYDDEMANDAFKEVIAGVQPPLTTEESAKIQRLLKKYKLGDYQKDVVVDD